MGDKAVAKARDPGKASRQRTRATGYEALRRMWLAPADAAFRASESQRPEPPKIGATLSGKYRLVRQIGEGGAALVYEAVHVRLRQRLAVKIPRPDGPGADNAIRRFEQEARILARLESIHVARVIDFDSLPSGLPYMVLEFLDGRDLEHDLAATGPMTSTEAADVVLQIAEAMAEAHAAAIVHRDLKPSNVFVRRVGPRRIVKVLDFGISKVDANCETRITLGDHVFGTPHYAAPEQLRDARAADERSDVWSLGAIKRCVTLQAPLTST